MFEFVFNLYTYWCLVSIETRARAVDCMPIPAARACESYMGTSRLRVLLAPTWRDAGRAADGDQCWLLTHESELRVVIVGRGRVGGLT